MGDDHRSHNKPSTTKNQRDLSSSAVRLRQSLEGRTQAPQSKIEKTKKLLKSYKIIKPHIKCIFHQVDEMNEEYKMDHKKKKPHENFDQSMFDDVWEIL